MQAHIGQRTLQAKKKYFYVLRRKQECMKRLIYWLNFKKRKEFRGCRSYCMNCPYFEDCKDDGEKI